MTDLLIRGIKAETMAFLYREADRNGASVEAVVRDALDALEEEERRMEEFRARANAFRAATQRVEHSDSAELRHIGQRG